jgi:integrase
MNGPSGLAPVLPLHGIELPRPAEVQRQPADVSPIHPDGETTLNHDIHTPFTHHLEGTGLAHRSVAEYTKYIRRADRWLAEHHGIRLPDAQPHQIRAWADTLPPSWSTRKQAKTSLAHWQKWAQHPHDLASAVPVPRKPRMRPRALPDAQAAKLEHEAHQAGLPGLAVLLGLYLGMRRCEIAAATWTGWDGTSFTWQRAKTGVIAVLPVHPRLAGALERAPRYGPYLFPSGSTRTGRVHVAPVTVWTWVKKVGEQAGVEVTTHQLRHTSITRVVDSMGIRVGQEWAGHLDPSVTAGYSMVTQRRLEEAAAQLAWGDNVAA